MPFVWTQCAAGGQSSSIWHSTGEWQPFLYGSPTVPSGQRHLNEPLELSHLAPGPQGDPSQRSNTWQPKYGSPVNPGWQ